MFNGNSGATSAIAQRQPLPTSLTSPAVGLSRSDAALFFLLFLLLGAITCSISWGPVKKYKHANLYENEGEEKRKQGKM